MTTAPETTSQGVAHIAVVDFQPIEATYDPPVTPAPLTITGYVPSEQQAVSRPAYKRADSALSAESAQTAAHLERSNQLIPKDIEDVQNYIVPQVPHEHVSPTYDYPPPPSAAVQEHTGAGLPSESTFKRRIRMLASFIAFFLAGWNGGSTGALVPYIEQSYHISYAQVSLLFVCTFVGYIVAALTAGSLSRKVGFGHALCIAIVVELMGNVINCSQHKSFGLLCFGFFVVGLSFATQLGICNAYFACLDKPLVWTGLLHGIYGLGAFASPLVATAMVTRGIPYNLFYTTNVGMNVPILVMIWLVFRDLQALPEHPGEVSAATSDNPHKALRETLKSRVVWILAIFLMLYVGAEESLGGWIVSYMLEVRKGSPEGASWVASGFYLGIAVGRIALPTLSLLMGERRAVYIYIAIAIALECLAWFIPVIASTAVCTALVGLAISTFYASAITVAGKLVPRSMHADAFALMSSVGQSGSAFWPLIIGVMSTKKGIWVVEPTVVALLGAQGICWWLVPNSDKRSK
ncbi:MFS general substrate transporter [Panus rudis PR-1116 ss-1]|nr:MFS general substrate transporter [Panus rudis PR-1116 ss-1]